MAQVISIVNQKGGVGKTTTAVNLSACLADAGRDVLLIDIDPQGNASSGVGIDNRTLNVSIYDVLVEDSTIDDVLLPSSAPNVSVVPSNSDLLSAEFLLATEEKGNSRLRYALYDYFWFKRGNSTAEFVIIDCPPSLGYLTINAILASDSIIIPVQCEYYALEGLTEILKSTTMIREQFNKNLALNGILLTMADRRLNLSRSVEEEIRNAYGSFVYNVLIPRSVRLSEAPSHGLPIIAYDFNSTGAQSYINLAQEVIQNEKKSSRPWPIRPSV